MKHRPKVANLPDVASQVEAQIAGQLDWVGMNEIELPVLLDGSDGRRMQTTARISAFVDLERPEKRGIHMSRLYLHLDRALAEHTVTPALLRHLLRDFLDSHEDLSSRAMIRLDFDYMLRRRSLASDNSGWKRYPISIIAGLEGREFELEMAFQVVYSSTCPCSAALARQLIQDQFRKDFADSGSVDAESVLAWLGSEEGIVATPHSQRSAADLRLQLAPSFEAFPFVEVIDAIEGALKTPVQAVVKREDEQAFALLNGQNLMFCEDAARRVQTALESHERVIDFWARCRHFESLHPHNAVAIVTKGVEGGYKPIDGQPSGWRHG
ncbi:GTP cyclohydrolase I FolE2 [Wenzhouxiangella sp. XN201]|uniref:GTP cyclohydrolase FolE2 n=1 Tax=Wenzhouxiangella sp. XN201 TaxID=2710755 RepID=UPI0013C6154A|nr:GTP cyclohydrolase FolE2 [Wenzhouxiangella sp. XN201]NEZ03831.1 GTP cyclohydrolase I FolE2 [Wenzhouxiangella sp. XN201]